MAVMRQHVSTCLPACLFLLLPLLLLLSTDPLAEDDWEGFAEITKQIGKEYEVGPYSYGT